MSFEQRIESLERAARLMASEPIVLFKLDPHEDGYAEAEAEIARWTGSGRTVVVIHQGHGYEVWDAGALLAGGIENAGLRKLEQSVEP